MYDLQLNKYGGRGVNYSSKEIKFPEIMYWINPIFVMDSVALPCLRQMGEVTQLPFFMVLFPWVAGLMCECNYPLHPHSL